MSTEVTTALTSAVSDIVDTAWDIVPIAFPVLAAMVGIAVIVKLVRKFTHA